MRLVSAIIYSFRARDLRQKYFITRIPARRAVQDKWSEPRTRKNIFKIRESFLKIIRSSCPQQHEQQRRLHQRLICRLSFSRTYKFLKATNRVTKILEKCIPIFPKGATAVFTFKILIFFKKKLNKVAKIGLLLKDILSARTYKNSQILSHCWPTNKFFFVSEAASPQWNEIDPAN